MDSNGPRGRVTSAAPEAQAGDVDEHGEIVDLTGALLVRARLERLRSAIGPDHSAELDPIAHVEAVARMIGGRP